MTNRCEWSDLPGDQCDHCGAAPGVRLPDLEPARPAREPAKREQDEARLERPTLPSTWAPSNDAGECRCGQPTRDGAWLCDDCEQRFTTTLADLGALIDEIDVTMTRQRAAATTGGPRSSHTSLPWHERAGDARRALHGLLVTWVRFCSEEDVRGPQIADPVDNVKSLASWLATRVHGLALLDIGPEAMDEITDAAAECHRLIFWKRKNRVYLGTCGAIETDDEGYESQPCPGEVYADEGEAVGHCDDCGQGVTVVIKRGQLETELDDRLYTASEIARLSTYLGLDVPRERVRRRVLYWHRHERVPVKGKTADGSPMFRYGDVKPMLYAEYGRRAS